MFVTTGNMFLFLELFLATFRLKNFLARFVNTTNDWTASWGRGTDYTTYTAY